MRIIFLLLKYLLKLANIMPSNAAPDVITLDGATTQSPTMTTLSVKRTSGSIDGEFGLLTINGRQICQTVENLSEMIEVGEYDAVIDLSPRLGYLCPHIRVPDRDQAAGGDAGIRVHILNDPCQSEGCIGTGTIRDGDAVDNSKIAFAAMMSHLPAPGTKFKVIIQ
jgi:hypothetical protein